MIKIINISILFAVALLLDILVFSALFSFYDGILWSIVLVAVLLVCGVNGRILSLGSVVCVFLEFFWRLGLGSLMLSFLITALVFFFLSSFLNIKINSSSVASLSVYSFLGLAMLTVFYGIFSIIGNIFYNLSGWSQWVFPFSDPSMAFFALVGFMPILAILNKICSEKNTKFH